jgi:predicted nucleic acid-binding protein
MRVLVDASVWIDHLRRSDVKLVALLQTSQVVMHPAVLGELACGALPDRQKLVSLWSALPRAAEVSSTEALQLIEQRRLWGRGLGWTDVQLLGSALLSNLRLWTRDRPLQQVANEVGVKFDSR